jgi:dienelactone hydrolase
VGGRSGRRLYELTRFEVPGPIEPIPVLLYHRLDIERAKPAVVYYHGVTQSKDAYVDNHPLARRLADEGMAVALPDAPGHGQRPFAATLVERLRRSLPHEFAADIEQAADEAPALWRWLEERPEVDPRRTAVAGTSMGGFTAAAVASRLGERLRAAVCIAGCADLPACFAATDSISPAGWGPPDRSIDDETRARIERIDAIGYPERFPPVPLLLLHGELDTWNPCSTSVRFAEALRPVYAACPDALRLRLVPDAPHWPPGPDMVEAAACWLRASLS